MFRTYQNRHLLKAPAEERYCLNEYGRRKKMILDDKRMLMVDLYNQLHDLGICKTRYEYSTYWLNRSKRYYSSVTNENRDVSIEPLMYAIARIKTLSDQCRCSTTPLLITKADKLDAIRVQMEGDLTKFLLTRYPN